MGRSGLFVLTVIVLLAIGGYFYFASQNDAAPLAGQTTSQSAPADTSSASSEKPPYGIPAGEATATGTAAKP